MKDSKKVKEKEMQVRLIIKEVKFLLIHRIEQAKSDLECFKNLIACLPKEYRSKS